MTEPNTLVRALNTWQASDHLHPLTCGNESSHRPLVPEAEPLDPFGGAVLVCPDCDYRQGVAVDSGLAEMVGLYVRLREPA